MPLRDYSEIIQKASPGEDSYVFQRSGLRCRPGEIMRK
jgi:hypothetical protein